MAELTHVKGLEDLQKLLDTLAPKIERNVMRGALREGALVVRDRAVENIRSDSGVLAASLWHKKAISTRALRGVVMAKLRAGYGFGQSGEPPANLPNWVEYGTRPHYVYVKGGWRKEVLEGGKVSLRTINRMVERGSLVIGGTFVGASIAHPGARPHPFMRPALDSAAGAAVVAVGEYIKSRLASKEGLDTSGIVIEEGE